MDQTDEVYVVDTWNVPSPTRSNVLDPNQVRTGILIMTRSKKCFPKKKEFRDGLSYSTPQKSKETRGNAIIQPRSHPFKDLGNYCCFFSAEDHNISMLVWAMSVLQPFSRQLVPRCADTPSYIHTHHPSHQWYQQLHFTHNYINVVA